MQFLKKHFKQLGTLVTIIALFFVVWKMITMDIDYRAFATPQSICILLVSILLQALIFCYMTFPWLHLVRIFSGKKISGKQALPVYTKSNLMKYIPGNVFHYVARNQLAAESQISHVDVAMATIVDIGMSILAPFLISLILMQRHIRILLSIYRNTFLTVLFLVIVLLCIVFILLRLKFWEQVKQYCRKYRLLLKRKTLVQLLMTFLLYLLQSLFHLVLYSIPLLFGLISIPSEKIPQFLGAYLFSWIIGFITPGSPGGIGVREAVMMLICNSFIDNSAIMSYVVMMRFVSICADVVAFGFGAVYKKVCHLKK
ncbi:MAG: flippase-like domain-containing protein [Oscillospiraceae bacterium]|nr:flippase-like domain-containing protein [Oscillospiraceae bacterium]